MSLDTVITELSRLCPGGVCRDVSLSQISRWRIGGKADVIIEPGSVEQLIALQTFIANEDLPSLVIGDTSNLLFSDEGLRAICIRIGARMAGIQIMGQEVTVQAGIWVPHFARRIQQVGLTGAEHICGIPGTLGGLICMNGGSQRKGIGSSVVEVTAIDSKGRMIILEQQACNFAYRQSVFQSNGAIVAAARLRFEHVSDNTAIRREMLSILRDRSRKFPRKLPNCGSVFKSNPAMYSDIGPPGAVIERLGFKGYQIGGAQVSRHHANFFVNLGGAKAVDMLRLIGEVGDTVFEKTGFRIESEVRFVTPDGSIHSAY